MAEPSVVSWGFTAGSSSMKESSSMPVFSGSRGDDIPTESTALSLWSDGWGSSSNICAASGLHRKHSAERDRGCSLGDDASDDRLMTSPDSGSATKEMNVFLHTAWRHFAMSLCLCLAV